MTEVLAWQPGSAAQTIVRRAAESLAGGKLVALPTETVYGLAASALRPEAVERLCQGKGRPEGKPLTLAIRRPAEALDWVPGISSLGRRLARRCWPGPLTLVFDAGVWDGLASRLPEGVRQRVCPTGTLGLRVPAHEAALRVLGRLAGPLVLTSANRSGEPAATTAQQVVDAVGEDLDLVVDSGPTRFGTASTVVQVNGNAWKVLREGVLPTADIGRQAACLILFICTGNTCRSPLAEALCKQLLAARQGCAPEDLPGRGFLVLSAGLAAMMGGRAAAPAVEIGRELGVDLSGHSSRPLTPTLAAQADYLIVMAESHRQALEAHFPQLGTRPRLLDQEGQDVADPIGGDQEVYRECAAQIRRHLERLLVELES
jgi:protein-tyrosine phosphatase